jgi:eukaryotic-like serine/threonine-protein kinase
MTIGTGTKLGPYEIVSPLGAGGMGEVYRAKDTRLDREVAIKILPADFAKDADRLRRFEQEARATSALNHPNILTVYDIGTHDGAPFIVAELLEGEELRAQLHHGALTGRKAVAYAQQIAAGLAAAHEKGVVHRDLKPENLFVTRDGRVKILDFGLAKLKHQTQAPGASSEVATQRALTDPGVVMGTAGYMSPEQVRGQDIDHRSDVFSFGVILYEMLSGKRAFEGDSAADVMSSILKEEPPEPGETKANPQLERVLRRCLEKKPERRFQSTSDLCFALEASSAPLAPTSLQAPLSQITHHKLPVALVLALVLLVIAAVGYYAFFARAGSGTIGSIAVMPFVNESGNADVEYLSDGMTESLIGSLSQLPNLNVKARSSVFRYKGKEFDLPKIAQELKVQAILTGRVIQRGDQLTLSLELMDARTENALWSEQYNRKQADLVSLQSEIAHDVSSKLKTRLSGEDEQKLTKKYTENAEAYQLYLKGRFFLNRRTSESLMKAIESFNQAIAIDPNYALSYAGLSDCYLLLGLPDALTGALSPQDSLPKARVAADKALQIDDSVGEVYFSLGQIRSKTQDWAGAESAFDRGLQLSPNYSVGRLYYAIYLSTLNRHDEAVKEIRRAQELDPLSLPINASVVYVLYLARQYDAAVEAGQKGLEMDAAFPLTHLRLGLAFVQKKMYREAVLSFQQAANNSNRAPLAIVSLGHAYAASGNKVESQRVLAELNDMSQRRYVSPYSVATIYAALGDKEQALQWLEKASDERNTEMVFIKVDPRLDSLRSDRRFGDLVKRVGFPN